ncbi:beta-lactamase-like protein [Methanosalsum zhilinae DSM 4017]|uniref:Beta-lactamase-like protein n=1 Tax=Methanosalsum zhilinae (strain DSM 4017 / NBRC 107636 / OCM 62 / WeN5) TaxID=679901 RepID=F7XMJ1_METZD|nr:MBL fold metallo-hydrolase [Methanosalsum zhilinae]AEH59914.1 beta-lactamase-like protein [Methanosalsum zhilinae DSM 4017]
MIVDMLNTSMYSSNTYLINKKIVIDPGMNPDILIKELEKYTSAKNIELIVLTHCHFDHTGAAKALVEKSNAKVGIHTDDVAGLMDDRASAASVFGQSAPGLTPDITYTEGDLISINSLSLQVIHTPGHTPGSICLYEPGSRSLFSGDTIFASGSIGRTDFTGGSSQKMITSIEKVTELDVERLYPGHGPVTDENVNRQINLSLQMAKTI